VIFLRQDVFCDNIRNFLETLVFQDILYRDRKYFIALLPFRCRNSLYRVRVNGVDLDRGTGYYNVLCSFIAVTFRTRFRRSNYIPRKLNASV